MVEINAWEPGINSFEENLYLRILNEFRIEFENNVLFFIDYLHSIKKQKVNSIYFDYEKKYLKELCNRYYVKFPNLKVNSQKENVQIDNILKLIKHVRKLIDYSYLDISDFYYDNFSEFIKIKINKNISTILKELLIKYNHKVPDKIKRVPREKSSSKNKIYCKEEVVEDDSILKEFYLTLKKSIDKAFLKFYDYLVETKLKEIRSQKVYFLKKDLEAVGKKYYKLKYKVKLVNKKSFNSEEKFLDETAANLLRFKEIL